MTGHLDEITGKDHVLVSEWRSVCQVPKFNQYQHSSKIRQTSSPVKSGRRQCRLPKPWLWLASRSTKVREVLGCELRFIPGELP